jgi:uncharacterized protein YciI
MASYFVVRRTPGPAWNPSLPMQSQALWTEHVAFMNRLESEGFIVLGGPVGREGDALLVVDAASEDAVVERLAQDPWTETRLRTDRIEPWTILLDSRAR